MKRFCAVGIHLAISVCLGAAALGAMLFLWYPGALFHLMGGARLVYLMVGVDICLGPLMTFIVFKQGKKSLKFDLAVIAVLQLGALVYGISIMYEARPAFIVFVKDQFRIVAANELQESNLSAALRPEWRHPPLFGPEIVVAIQPSLRTDIEAVSFAEKFGGGVQWFPKFFVPFGERRMDVLKASKPLSQLIEFGKLSQADTVRMATNDRKLSYLPLYGGFGAMLALVDSETGDFVEILNVIPK